MLNIDPVREYCKCLSENPREIWTFGLFDESGKGGIVPGYGTFFCPLDELQERLSDVQIPFSLHVTLNQTSLSGRRTEHIQSCRVLCVDIDRVLTREEIKSTINLYKPDMAVESSPSKHHLYWKISPAVRLDAWKLYQAGLALELGGDLNLCGVTHMIRVPGFKRVCKDGSSFIPDIIWLADSRGCLTDAGIRAKWPWIIARGKDGFEVLRTERTARARALRVKRQADDGSEVALTAAKGGRNDSLYSAVNSWVFKNHIDDMDAAIGLALELNQQFAEPLEESEVVCVGRSAYLHAVAAWTKTRREMSVLLPPINLPESGNNGHQAAASHSAEVHAATASSSEIPAKPRKAEYVLPPDIAAAADRLVDELWQLQPKTSTTLITQSLRTGQFDRLLEWFVRNWSRVGRMGVVGPAIFVRGESAWGSEVWRCKELTKEQLMSVFAKICSGIVMRALRSEKYRKLVRKPPRYSALGSAAEWAWRAFMCRAGSGRQDGGIIAYQNGVLDLESGVFVGNELAPKQFSHAIDAEFDGEAARSYQSGGLVKFLSESRAFGKFLEDWFPGDWATKELVMRWFGYCMTTEYNKQKFMFMWGPTGSGKGSLCSILGGLLGCEHCTSMNYGALAGSGAGAGRFQEADMHNRLLITIEEAEGTVGEHAGRMDRLKKVVGGERVMIERKWGHPFQDWIIGKLILQSNVAPVYQDKGGAIRARMIPVGFEHSFRERPSVVPPAQLVFESGEANAIATAAGLCWSAVRGQALPFVVEGSRALEVGREAIESEMDLLGSTFNKCGTRGTGKALSSSAANDLLRLAFEDRGIPYTTGTMERDIKAWMSQQEGVKYTRFRRAGRGSERIRGWIGIGLERDLVLRRFDYLPEIIEQYPALAEEIGIKDSGCLEKLSVFES